MTLNDRTATLGLPRNGRCRVVVSAVQPSVDNGRYSVKRVLGETVVISCDLVSDGHDALAAVACLQGPGAEDRAERRLLPKGNDRWEAQVTLDLLGRWAFAVVAWVDDFATWRYGLERKFDAGQEVRVELLAGAKLVRAASTRATGSTQEHLNSIASQLESGAVAERVSLARSDELSQLMADHPDRTFSTQSPTFTITSEAEIAQFSAWYELFPRSFGAQGKHGTFADVQRLLPYVASMGFDVLYLPPIHPIGRTFRKGPNNSLGAADTDPGSPWAIGAKEGGHKDVHPELGTVADFERLVLAARESGLEIALDIAFQASPDHPYVRDHPEWFQHRADGTIQYAENPPKKYQDVYPFDLAGPAWEPLWEELLSVFQVWIERGVRIFRVDNPHTKPLAFWEYCIGRIKQDHPNVIFLAEAFTRPKVMLALAKAGFSQSYTYFTWRTTSHELKGYLDELNRPPVSEVFRPNLWPNTPDILPEHLQYGGRPTYVARMVLAGTLSASWGIYGPSFELMESVARPGSEEYIDNEKFQLRSWDLERPDSLRHIIARFNAIRRTNPALRTNRNLCFHSSDNDNILAYSKADESTRNVIVVVVNLDPHHRHTAWLRLDLARLLIEGDETFQAHDLLSDARYLWSGERVFVDLDPSAMPAHILKIRTKVRSERSFEYFL